MFVHSKAGLVLDAKKTKSAGLRIGPLHSAGQRVFAVSHGPTGVGWPSAAGGSAPTSIGEPDPATDSRGLSLAAHRGFSSLRDRPDPSHCVRITTTSPPYGDV